MSKTILGIVFRTAGKIYFHQSNQEYEISQGLIIETQRGVEYGEVISTNNDKNDDGYIKSIIREFRESDLEALEENYKKSAVAHNKIKMTVKELKLPMKILDTEYLFDGTKAIFTFSSGERVDFRGLVKDLASDLKVSIELKQVGPRDEAKILGGLGPCGRATCCSKHLRNFNKVSMKMAKCQKISLAQDSINGLCNRLKCCLEHEYPAYRNAIKIMPQINSIITTPDGKGKVVYNDLLNHIVAVRLNKEGESEIQKYELDKLR